MKFGKFVDITLLNFIYLLSFLTFQLLWLSWFFSCDSSKTEISCLNCSFTHTVHPREGSQVKIVPRAVPFFQGSNPLLFLPLFGCFLMPSSCCVGFLYPEFKIVVYERENPTQVLPLDFIIVIYGRDWYTSSSTIIRRGVSSPKLVQISSLFSGLNQKSLLLVFQPGYVSLPASDPLEWFHLFGVLTLHTNTHTHTHTWFRPMYSSDLNLMILYIEMKLSLTSWTRQVSVPNTSCNFLS